MKNEIDKKIVYSTHFWPLGRTQHSDAASHPIELHALCGPIYLGGSLVRNWIGNILRFYWNFWDIKEYLSEPTSSPGRLRYGRLVPAGARLPAGDAFDQKCDGESRFLLVFVCRIVPEMIIFRLVNELLSFCTSVRIFWKKFPTWTSVFLFLFRFSVSSHWML